MAARALDGKNRPLDRSSSSRRRPHGVRRRWRFGWWASGVRVVLSTGIVR